MIRYHSFRILLSFCLLISLLLGTGLRSAEAADASTVASDPAAEEPAAESAGEQAEAEKAETEKPGDDGRDLTPLPDEWFDDALFIGDSITATLQGWSVTNHAFGEAIFLPTKSYSVRRDVSGMANIAFRAKYWRAQDVVGEVGAKKLFLMIGMNDISGKTGVEVTMPAWEDYISGIQECNPDTRIFIQSLVPSYETAGYRGLDNEKIDRYNEALRSFCEESGCIFVEIASYLKNEENNLIPEYSLDRYVHLNRDGVAVWAEQLKNPANYSVDPRSTDNEK